MLELMSPAGGFYLAVLGLIATAFGYGYEKAGKTKKMWACYAALPVGVFGMANFMNQFFMLGIQL